MTQEIWKDIDELDRRFEVSDQGRVRNKITGHILKPVPMERGYLRVSLSYNGKGHTKKIHKLVAIAFVPNPLNKSEINHINGNKLDNRAVNLEWATRKENMEHASKNGYLNVPHTWHNDRIYCKINGKEYRYASLRQASKQTGIPKEVLSWLVHHQEEVGEWGVLKAPLSSKKQ